MNFALDDDQRMLQETVQRLVARDGGLAQRQTHAASALGWSHGLWARYAEIGLLALPYPSAYGGLGGSAVDQMLVFQALGPALALEPLLSTAVIGSAALRGASDSQCKRWVPPIAAGELTLAWAHDEAASRHRLFDVTLRARPVHGGWLLEGHKAGVLHGDSADRLLVSARVAGSRRDRDGLALFIVDAQAAGIERTPWRCPDGLGAADISFDGVLLAADDAIGAPGQAAGLIESVTQAAIAALAAEAVGVMDSLLALTVEHLKTRSQFGGPIARFQALQHRAAEMLIALEQARSMAMYAALMLAEPDAAERSKALSAVKVLVGQSARFVGQQAVQLHGGIGVTEECAVGLGFKRLTMIEQRFGDSDHHLACFARAGGFISPEAAA